METTQDPLVKTDSDVTTSPEAAIIATNPKLVEFGTNGQKAVRFDIVIRWHDGSDVLHVPGFRIARGRIEPPARKGPKGQWYPVVNLEFFGQHSLRLLVKDWKASYPEVEFPQ